MRILVVEDDPTTLLLLETALQSKGYDLTLAQTGEEAWLSILAGDYQTIICDWRLPGLTGIELCQKIRTRKTPDYTYFILITGYEGKDKLQEAMDAGVDDFLTKPLDMDSLEVRLRVANRILNFHQQIGALKELLPICMYCKKIRKDSVYWENVETYINSKTGSDFTHSLCPDCYTEKIIPQINDLNRKD